MGNIRATRDLAQGEGFVRLSREGSSALDDGDESDDWLIAGHSADHRAFAAQSGPRNGRFRRWETRQPWLPRRRVPKRRSGVTMAEDGELAPPWSGAETC